MLSVLDRILWLQPLPLSFPSTVCLVLKSWRAWGWVVPSVLLAHTGTHCNAVDRLLGLLGLPLVTKPCGLVGGTLYPALNA